MPFLSPDVHLIHEFIEWGLANFVQNTRDSRGAAIWHRAKIFHIATGPHLGNSDMKRLPSMVLDTSDMVDIFHTISLSPFNLRLISACTSLEFDLSSMDFTPPCNLHIAVMEAIFRYY
ncbi:unnamed protein product [Chondrus crispus]|uniref:Uncharacterized protein n=1 Tax=Chondrus crispus TaxID=2769 RepID=R7Q881_CHOCR|nr:unnamed protein product [Chondrus crispus]CDF33581.1 unnamed protein product [Chondrus crispus]|eukprot:XP_005713384.1 unnamed protein product [Chondrus crispus]